MLSSEKIKKSIPSRFGHVQRSIIFDLLQYGKTATLHNYMKKQAYYTNYCRTIENAIQWLKDQGLNIKYVPGKLGGDWTAHYFIEA